MAANTTSENGTPSKMEDEDIGANMDLESHNMPNIEEGDGEDMEGIDMKAKALTKLLQTSSVFVAIMADKMKEQQKKQRDDARKEAARKRAAAEKEKKAIDPVGRRSTRVTEKLSHAQKQGDAAGGDATVQSTTTRKLPTRERNKKNAKDTNSITNYFKQADVKAAEANTSVQEALAQAADEFESKPSALGEQDLEATQQPSLITGGQMREYQLEGLEWLKSLWMNGLCGILADEMGLGKTIQAISLIAFFKEHKIPGPFLIAAPLSTVSNWVNEFARWTPSINTVLYHGTKDERSEIRKRSMQMQDQKNVDFPVICTSYEICMNDRKYLANYQWKYIIVDEGHRLKNMNCRLVKELLSYQSANRLLITGTPLQNNIAELWSLLHFLLPEIFNDLDNFENWFDFSSVLDSSGKQTVAERRKRNLVSTMHAILKPFLLRRVKTDVESTLPKKREYILYAPMTPEQKELYIQIVNGTSRQYLEEKAAERIEARNGSGKQSRAQSLKRKVNSSGASTPNKSLKSSRDSTPSAPLRSGRPKRGQRNYREVSDREFDAKLRKLENGDEEDDEPESSGPSENEMEEIERAKTIRLAKKEISSKKLQNPIMQARLACNSPLNFYWPWDENSPGIDSTIVTSSGKMLLLDRLVPCLMSKGHKILLFSQFKNQLDILEDWATLLHSWKCCRIDGAIAQSDRQEQINAFNADPEYRIFLLSTRAGGQGINLTAADTVILYDSDWNPQQDLQAQDRAHRIGQTKPVIVYRLATRGTVEASLLERADSKRRLEKLVIQKGKFKNLLENSSTNPANIKSEADDLKKLFGDDGIEIFDVGAGSNSESLLSQPELDILTDRSDEAYTRAEQGLDKTGHTFLAVQPKTEAA